MTALLPAEALAVRVAGCGPTLGWIHGYTMTADVFADIWPLFPGFRHVGVDLPGHGRSADRSGGGSLADIAALVARTLADHGARSVVAVSMGTMVAFEMVIGRLLPLDKLAVIAPALVGMPAGEGTAALYRRLGLLRRLDATPAQLARTWTTAPTGIFAGLAERPERLAAMVRVVAGHDWTELDHGGPAAFYRHPQRLADLPGSARELLLVTGGRDMPEFRALAAELARDVPGARVAHFPTAGHLPLFEEPATVAAALQDFLRATPGPADSADRSPR